MPDPSPPRPPRQAPILRRLVLARTGGRMPQHVAVVGNAPLEPSAARAAAIDGADLVVRMTTFALDSSAPVIGRRTDVVVLHRAVRPGPDTFADLDRRLYLLAEPGRRFWEPGTWPAWWPTALDLVPIANEEFTERTRSALRYGRRAILWPTTGTLAVHLMHRLFPHARISLAGTSLAGPGGRRPRVREFAHAWGDVVTLTPEHRPAREAALLASWRAEGWLEVLS